MTQQPDATPKVVSGSDQAAAEAAPAPARQRNTPARAAEPDDAPARDEDLSARAAELEAELADVRARAAGDATVRMRVEGVHSDFYHGGVGVSSDWTVVPAHMVPALTEAAANAGVTLTQEETES